ncbi:MAG: VWA domain-containing protein [Hamadaea sp.]|uniref:VWA domain-containing protein n=1 Tax=Hamadaea sp. TaxID=2024425 RepID=UPI00180130F6|nr:VWA domain-containing protein [Hamadaea sp.]NUR70488.1 VWA domain-containing protein [Hamadaea sp.]NUT18095.1 VWA domain-containing protein [Hamadaea sp.]
MTVMYPLLVVVAVLLAAGAITAYVVLARRRSAALRNAGLGAFALAALSGRRRHLPYALFLAALPLLLLALARPTAEIKVPRVSGTVILVLDVSQSMTADDVKPSRLAATKSAAAGFAAAQPSTVDMGVVVFGPDGLATQAPTADHQAVLAAIDRASASGGTSLRQAILVALTAIVGKQVALPADGQAPDLGYWGSATIVLFSDGEDTSGGGGGGSGGAGGDTTGGVQTAADLAATAGVRIETVGIGTAQGAIVEADGYQVATALHEDVLTNLAATTGGSYHPASDADQLNQIHRSIDLRLTSRPETVELTGVLAVAALLLLTAGGLLMISWHGRIV